MTKGYLGAPADKKLKKPLEQKDGLRLANAMKCTYIQENGRDFFMIID